jgi:hypothetical protein
MIEMSATYLKTSGLLEDMLRDNCAGVMITEVGAHRDEDGLEYALLPSAIVKRYSHYPTHTVSLR